jgi:nucleotide-binding universal stress UspA family protein
MKLPETILVPTDFSEQSAAALDYAIPLAAKLGARVHVVHAYELPIIGFPDGAMTVSAEMASRIIDAAQKALHDLEETYGKRGVNLTTSLEQADPREGILAAARKTEAGLIIMGTHARRGVARALIGSVAESVLRTSPIPVLTVH